MIDLAPGAIWTPSVIAHPMRSVTLGVVIHRSYGREAGDVATLSKSGKVDAHFEVAKDGDVYQFLDPDSCAWHAYSFANDTCVGIEHEGGSEAFTPEQTEASAKLVAWLCKRYAIPVVHVDPSGHDAATFRGIFGHKDLSVGGVRVDSNDHTDTMPDDPGWDIYLRRVNAYMGIGSVSVDLSTLPGNDTLRLFVGGRGFYGWDNAAGPIRWIVKNGVADKDAVIAWQGNVWRGPEKVEGVARHLAAKYL